MKITMVFGAIVITAVSAITANATSIIAENGDWQVATLAHAGDDHETCAISYHPSNTGKTFEFAISDNAASFFFIKESWKLPVGTKTKIIQATNIQPNGAKMDAVAVNPNTLEVRMIDKPGEGLGAAILLQVMVTGQMPGLRYKFAGNEADWQIPTEQLSALDAALGDCIMKVKNFTPGKEDSTTSQPFAAAGTDANTTAAVESEEGEGE